MTAQARAEEPAVWGGYCSNMSQQNLRQKKQLNPLGSRRTVVWLSLSVPRGRHRLRRARFRDPEARSGGARRELSLCRTDADSLDRQEARTVSRCAELVSRRRRSSLDVEVYVPGRPLAITQRVLLAALQRSAGARRG